MIKNKEIDENNIFNAPFEYFYPVPFSDYNKYIFNGQFLIQEDKSWAVHWWGGHGESQNFNKIYTQDFARTSNDSISVWLRKKNIL